MPRQAWPRRLFVNSARVTGYALGAVGLCIGAFVVFVARHPPTGATWPATYSGFLSGSTALPVSFFLPVVVVLFSLAVLHAVWRENVAFLTFAPAVIPLRFGSSVAVDAGAVPALGVAASLTGRAGDTVVIPVWFVVLFVGAAWNLDGLLGRSTSEAGAESESVPTADTLGSADSRRDRWRLVTAVGGYTLTAVCVALGLWFVTTTTGPGLANVGVTTLAFAAVVYEFVSTDSLLGTAGLAAGAWITGVAALQYDGALPGVALPAAVLLTLAVAGLWLDGR